MRCNIINKKSMFSSPPYSRQTDLSKTCVRLISRWQDQTRICLQHLDVSRFVDKSASACFPFIHSFYFVHEAAMKTCRLE